MEYMLVSGKKSTVEETVNKMIQDWWRPCGGISITNNSLSPDKYFYSQAMIKNSTGKTDESLHDWKNRGDKMKLIFLIVLFIGGCTMSRQDVIAAIKECEDAGLTPQMMRLDGLGPITNVECVKKEVIKWNSYF